MNKKYMKSLLLAAVLLAASGCSAATDAETAIKTPSETGANSEISTAPVGASVAGETQTDAPAALVRDLYKTHDADLKGSKDRILDGKSRALLDKYFDKTLADFIWKDLTTQRDEVGVLDFDPFYNAQDVEIKNLAVGQPKIEGEKATVVVTFQNYERKDTLIYSLIRQNSAWKISDIKYTDGSTLIGYFKEDAKKNAAASSEERFFAGTYKVGATTCTVKPIKMAFELKWAKGSGTMIFVFDGDAEAGNYSYSSEDGGKGKDTFVFDDDTFTKGKFIRADGVEMPVSKIN